MNGFHYQVKYHLIYDHHRENSLHLQQYCKRAVLIFGSIVDRQSVNHRSTCRPTIGWRSTDVTMWYMIIIFLADCAPFFLVLKSPFSILLQRFHWHHHLANLAQVYFYIICKLIQECKTDKEIIFVLTTDGLLLSYYNIITIDHFL